MSSKVISILIADKKKAWGDDLVDKSVSSVSMIYFQIPTTYIECQACLGMSLTPGLKV